MSHSIWIRMKDHDLCSVPIVNTGSKLSRRACIIVRGSVAGACRQMRLRNKTQMKSLLKDFVRIVFGKNADTQERVGEDTFPPPEVIDNIIHLGSIGSTIRRCIVGHKGSKQT
jgi:hypothetical protein